MHFELLRVSFVNRWTDMTLCMGFVFECVGVPACAVCDRPCLYLISFHLSLILIVYIYLIRLSIVN